MLAFFFWNFLFFFGNLFSFFGTIQLFFFFCKSDSHRTESDRSLGLWQDVVDGQGSQPAI